MRATRVIAFLFAAIVWLAHGSDALAEPRHGLSVFGTLKYPADFSHFDYADPAAPKGGRLSLVGSQGSYNVNVLTFNTLNGFVLKGDAPFGIQQLVFDTLMARAFDEPDAVYGLVAESAELAEDGLGVTFHLREAARFSDGSDLTADDVVFSFDILKQQGHPALTGQIRDVVSAEALDAATVRYTFAEGAARNLAIRVALLPIFSKAYYADRRFDEATLDPPVGSGPYAIGKVAEGRSITYVRRDDYWAADLPVNRGRYNFDEITFEYFRDRTTGLEAFKAGEYDLREEFTASVWETGYDIAAVAEGRIVRDVLPDDRPSGAQGFFINTRLPKFSDPRVRRALDLAFDFEWTNKTLFHGLYRRTHSFFENSDMRADGLPSEAELALLEPWRDSLPAGVFETPYLPPETDGSGQDRRLLREAAGLLKEAGLDIVDGILQLDDGRPFTIEFLVASPSIERIIAPYLDNLGRLGIDAKIRRVDAAQYQLRLQDFDFDIAVRRYSLSPTPGAELTSFWGSQAAETPGSLNLSGIAHPAIDALIETIAVAETRDDLVAATRALDRILRLGHYWVPHWYKPSHTIAYWNRFSRPQFKPKYTRGILDTWWFDTEKAAKLDYSD